MDPLKLFLPEKNILPKLKGRREQKYVQVIQMALTSCLINGPLSGFMGRDKLTFLHIT